MKKQFEEDLRTRLDDLRVRLKENYKTDLEVQRRKFEFESAEEVSSAVAKVTQAELRRRSDAAMASLRDDNAAVHERNEALAERMQVEVDNHELKQALRDAEAELKHMRKVCADEESKSWVGRIFR